MCLESSCSEQKVAHLVEASMLMLVLIDRGTKQSQITISNDGWLPVVSAIQF